MISANGPGGEGAWAPRAPASPRDAIDYQRLLERVPAILYTAAPGTDGAWHYVSPQIETILGFTPEEWCADPMLWCQRLHPDDVEHVLAAEAAAASRGVRVSGDEYRLLHRNGHVVWVRDEAQLVQRADGTTCWHGVLSDITARKRTEASLERAAAQHAAAAALGEHALEGVAAAELAQEAATTAVELLELDRGGVLELDPDGSRFTFLAACRMPPQATGPIPFDLETQPGYAVAHGAVIVSDWTTETRFHATTPVRHTNTRSGMAIVIEGRLRPFGVIGVHSDSVHDFSKMDIDFVQTLANVLSDAFERQLTDRDIHHRGLHDPLTGLPNRTLFMDRLGQGLQRLSRRDLRAAILFLDIDRFKLVNESLGHEVGDELLAAAAARLRHTLRASDTVARFGADEFGILLEDIGGEHDAVDMAGRIATAFRRPFVLAGDEHFVTTSVGIALAVGGERPEDLIRDAEVAMHRAKERGRARYELFDEALRGRAMHRLRVENDLRRALEREELSLDYQPVVRLRDRSIAGVEALLRWDHPERGRVPPLDFIPIAEENGLIEPIGRWVLERACRQAAEWSSERPDGPPISVAVNLSAVQFENADLPASVAASLRRAGLDPALLSLEITESVMMGHAAELVQTLTALKEIGVRLILDDFGTGYSSLAYLSRLPLDVLKVDRSFVDGLGRERRDTAITEAIVAMSHALSLDVVGEGAETEQQIAELERLGCNFVQGYHFSRPVAAPDISEMLLLGTPWPPHRPAYGSTASVQRGGSGLQR